MNPTSKVAVYRSKVTFQNYALCSLPPNLVHFLWALPWMPALKPELSSHTSPFQVVSGNSWSSSTVALCFWFPLNKTSLKSCVFPTSMFSPPVASWVDSSQAVIPIPLSQGHWILPLSSTDTPHTPSFWEAFLSWPPQHLVPLVLSFLLRLHFSLFLLPSWISKVWNDARLSSCSSSIYLLLSSWWMVSSYIV